MKPAPRCVLGLALLMLSQSAWPQDQDRESELACLAEALSFEGRGEGLHGMVAIALVIKNRVAARRYPSSVCEVVHQGPRSKGSSSRACQFSYWCDGKAEFISDPGSWSQAQLIAGGVLHSLVDMPPVGAATHYHSTKCTPAWASKLRFLGQIKRHKFYVE